MRTLNKSETIFRPSHFLSVGGVGSYPPGSDLAMAMKMNDATLPWSDAKVRASENLNPLIAEALGGDYARYLPQRITLFADVEVADSAIESFVWNLCDFFRREMSIRSARVWRLTSTSEHSADEMEYFLTAHSGVQRWGLYYSKDGGPGFENEADFSRDRGLVPCSTMRNHGVGWLKTGQECEIWLATARKLGQPWDMDSDIGHESAHAAFAPVPLFVQPVPGGEESASLAEVTSADALRPEQVARMLYLFSELAVVAIRGEIRPTYTRLPIADPEELYALLSIGDDVFRGAGFDRAARACSRALARFDASESDAIFQIAAPIIRILPGLRGLVGAFTPPTVAELRKLNPAEERANYIMH